MKKNYSLTGMPPWLRRIRWLGYSMVGLLVLLLLVTLGLISWQLAHLP